MRHIEVGLAKAYSVDLAKVQCHAEVGMKFAKLAGAGDDFYHFLLVECMFKAQLRNSILPGDSSGCQDERKNP
jgi:hypothetical protein